MRTLVVGVGGLEVSGVEGRAVGGRCGVRARGVLLLMWHWLEAGVCGNAR